MASRRIVNQNVVTGKHPGRTAKVSNLFDGLIRDRTMQMPMHYSDKGKRSRPQLVTNCEDINGARPNTISYARFEKMFVRFLDDLDWTTILDITESDELRRQEEIIASLNLDITRGESEAAKIADLLVGTPSKTLKDRLLKVEARTEKDKADKDTAEKRSPELMRKHNELLDKSVIYSMLVKAHDFETRARLRKITPSLTPEIRWQDRASQTSSTTFQASNLVVCGSHPARRSSKMVKRHKATDEDRSVTGEGSTGGPHRTPRR